MSEIPGNVVDDRAKRARDEAGAGSEALIDLAELQEELQVPASDPELGSSEPIRADSAADAGQIQHWRTKANEYLELAQRKEAEQRNYMKRVSIDIDDARRFAVEGLLESLFPALDGLAQAAAQYKEIADGENPLLDGLRRTVKIIDSALLKHGIEKINSCPAEFNPELHQAIKVEDSAEVKEDTVVEIYVEGYRLGSTVLKPAMVRLAKAV